MRKLCMLTLVFFAVAVGAMVYDHTTTSDTYTISITDGAGFAAPAVALITAPVPVIALVADNAHAWEYDAPSANLILGDLVTDLSGSPCQFRLIANQENHLLNYSARLDFAKNAIRSRTFLTLNRAVTDLVI